MKRNKNKGFTLVELLVVIVIMCILAAILIPTFAKYVKRANNASIVAEARAAHVAASVIYQDQALAGGFAAITNGTLDTNALQAYTDVDGELSAISVTADGTVTGFTYTNAGKTVTWTRGNSYEVAEGTNEP